MIESDEDVRIGFDSYHRRVLDLEERWESIRASGRTILVGVTQDDLDAEFTSHSRGQWWVDEALHLIRPRSPFDENVEPGVKRGPFWLAAAEVVDLLLAARRRGEL